MAVQTKEKQSTSFVIQGNTVTLSKGDLSLHSSLPVGVYRVFYDEKKVGLKRETGAVFKLPEKVFGNYKSRFDLIVDAYKRKGSSLGVLLDGGPGSGKTVLMKGLSLYALENNIPVIIIDQIRFGQSDTSMVDQIFSLLDNSIGKALIQFDEFEKVFEDIDDQNKVLTFLDGVVKRNFLSVLCVNDSSLLEKPLLSRPSRVKYKFTYGQLNQAEVEEIVDYYIRAASKRKSFKRNISSLKDRTYDNIITLIKEVKETGVSIEDAIENLSLERLWFVEKKAETKPSIELRLDGVDLDLSHLVNERSFGGLLDYLKDNGRGGSHVELDLDNKKPMFKKLFKKGDVSVVVSLKSSHVSSYDEENITLNVMFALEGEDNRQGTLRIFRNGVL